MTVRAAAVLALLFFSTSALAVGVNGDAAAGKQKAGVCAACHGSDGNKTLDGTYPRLAGQHPDYLAKVLHDYKSGKRKNAIMVGQVTTLSDKDIADLATYYASLPGEMHDLGVHGD